MAPVYVLDDRSLFAVTEAVRPERHVELFEQLNELIDDDLCLRFPKEVVDDIRLRADPESDNRLVIWTTAIWPRINIKVSYGRRGDAQAWAQDNGYRGGLDPALGGRESCIVAVVAYVIELLERDVDVVVVTADYRARPGRAPLGQVARQLGCTCISPVDFVQNVLAMDISAA